MYDRAVFCDENLIFGGVFGKGITRVCLANQVGGKESAEKPILEERRCTSEANEKMVLEPLSYSSDTP
jgi:hypothetical protein